MVFVKVIAVGSAMVAVGAAIVDMWVRFAAILAGPGPYPEPSWLGVVGIFILIAVCLKFALRALD